MTGIVFVLCALTSLACAVLLLRGYSRTRARLLLWTGLCFAGLCINNVLLIVDSQTPNVDLSVWRSLPAVAGLALLVYGLIWDADQ
jgi:drug/metabolite transporter (DMT)-like permease